MSEKDPKRSFLEKHPPKSPQELADTVKRIEEAKKKYTQDVSALEQNLKDFNAIEDPLVDPATDKPLCWVKRPTRAEFEKLVPPELMKYKNSIESVPKDIADKYEGQVYTMMAELIAKPKHDANWWKDNSNLVFLTLFQNHLLKIYEDLGIAIENF